MNATSRRALGFVWHANGADYTAPTPQTTEPKKGADANAHQAPLSWHPAMDKGLPVALDEAAWRAREVEDRRQGHCGKDYDSCYSSRCCETLDFGCFKQPTQMYAQCRPHSFEHCRSSASWLCPQHWLSCARVGQNCIDTRCCQNVGFQCYVKEGNWAQCLESCVPGMVLPDDESETPRPWECDVLAMPPPPPKPPPSAPPPPPDPSPPPPTPSVPPSPYPPGGATPPSPSPPPSPPQPPPAAPPLPPEWACAAGRTVLSRPCSSLATADACAKAYFVHEHRMTGTAGDLWLCAWAGDGSGCQPDKTACDAAQLQRQGGAVATRLDGDGAALTTPLPPQPPPPAPYAPLVGVSPLPAGDDESPLAALVEVVVGMGLMLLCLRCLCTRVGMSTRAPAKGAAPICTVVQMDDYYDDDDDEFYDDDYDDDARRPRGARSARGARSSDRQGGGGNCGGTRPIPTRPQRPSARVPMPDHDEEVD
tara:strand:+ start:1264 stop:2700 length:1437 start_codon:yes stop_codon:yes gene_type:complete